MIDIMDLIMQYGAARARFENQVLIGTLEGARKASAEAETLLAQIRKYHANNQHSANGVPRTGGD